MAAKNNNIFSKIYFLLVKPLYTFFILTWTLLIKFVMLIPNLISDKLKHSISFKISAAYLKTMSKVFTLIVLGALLLLFSVDLQDTINSNNKALYLIEQNKDYAINNLINSLNNNQFHFSIYDNSDRRIYSTNDSLDSVYNKYSIPFILNNSIFYFAYKYKILANDTPHTLIIYHNIEKNINYISHLSIVILPAILAGILITSLIGLGISKKMMHSIQEMTQTVKGISENNLNLRINVSGSKDELKELAKTFNEMMNRIEDAYNKQQQFVSDASHELRTPISVIQGYANLLNRWGKDDPKVLKESIDALINESGNMKDLVEKLLFIARSDKGTLKLQKESFNLSSLLLETIKEFEMIDKSHLFKYNINENIMVCADKSRIKQAVRIIIDNAIKYTPVNGIITIQASVEGRYSIIFIADTGIGIEKNDLNHIFERFYRSDKSRSKEKGGHGLGLYIAKIIILQHKGKISVKSKFNQGTEFKIYLPLD